MTTLKGLTLEHKLHRVSLVFCVRGLGTFCKLLFLKLNIRVLLGSAKSAHILDKKERRVSVFYKGYLGDRLALLWIDFYCFVLKRPKMRTIPNEKVSDNCRYN